ncbi:Hypp8880 [Branchiostoma lanceolatum]|uniref:Hypp8880 protein n=1 Tax=Branchiostoma lanceolatum TaxID=7740 RepID=A0A8J9ZCA3_BRALA|nr:Hypp8880 [Branchiostoma lanceolatum]
MGIMPVVLLVASISGSHGNRCTKTLPTTGHIRYSSRDSAQALVETFIQSSIKPGETLCFTLHDLANDDASSDVSISMATNGSVPLLWQLTYEGIEMDYGVKNRYSFYRPKYESDCNCDCPQWGDYCNSKTDRCSEHELDFCYNTYIPDQTAHGCAVYWKSEDSEVCCALYVGKDPSSPKYDAVYLSSDGKPVAKFTLKVYDSRTDEVVFSYPAFTVGLNDRSYTEAQHWVRLELTGDTPTQIDSGYYYTKSEETQVYTDVNINGLNEFDPRKMGWLKVRGDGTVERPPERTVVDAFHIKTKRCHNNFDYSETWQIYGHGNWEDHSGSSVEDFYDWVREARYSRERRMVTVIPQYDRLVTVKIGINTTTNVLFLYHDSDLIDFTAEVRVDRHSNRFANITLVAAVGSLVGSIAPYDGDSSATVHRFELHVASPSATNAVKRIPLPKTINGTSRMCLSPLSKPGNEVCKTVPFVQEALQDFIVPPTWRPGNPGDAGAGFNFNWLLDFFGFLNPAEWFNGIQGWLELFAMMVDIFLFIAAIFLFIKICTWFNVAGFFTTKVPKLGEGVEMSLLRRQRAEHGDLC